MEGVAPDYHTGAARSLSADYTWRQLVPDFAALVRSVCMALEAWPQDVPVPEPLRPKNPGMNLDSPLGLQYIVRRPGLSTLFGACADVALSMWVVHKHMASAR